VHIVNKTELAHLLGITEVTLAKWMRRRPGFPVIDVGSRGTGYRFNYQAVVAFLAKWRADEAAQAEQAQRQRAAAEALLRTIPRPVLTPPAKPATVQSILRDRLLHAKLATLQRQEIEARSQLVRTDEAEVAWIFVIDRLQADTLAFFRQIGVEKGWSDDVAADIERRIEDRFRLAAAPVEQLFAAARERRMLPSPDAPELPLPQPAKRAPAPPYLTLVA
jgi:phage terminase Nu1 subunit (DNA packaging protein)